MLLAPAQEDASVISLADDDTARGDTGTIDARSAKNCTAATLSRELGRPSGQSGRCFPPDAKRYILQAGLGVPPSSSLSLNVSWHGAHSIAPPNKRHSA